MNFRILKYLPFLSLLLIFSCDEVEYNPYDIDNNPDYIPPETNIIEGPSEGETLDVTAIVVRWEGNEMIIDFSYKLDSNDWSEWEDVTSVTLEYLDEGTHSFSVKGRYTESIEDETPASVSFTVDAVQGPALRIYPMLTEVTSGETFSVDLLAEEVSSLTFGEVKLSYDPSFVTFDLVENIGFLVGNDDDIIFISEHINENQINISFALTQGQSLEGTGELCSFTFSAISSGDFPLMILGPDSTKFRDSDNNNIPINDISNGMVVVE